MNSGEGSGVPDSMDHVQQLTADLAADALKRHADRPRPAGRTMCANLDCGEPISDYRRMGGAQLCLDCAHAEEAAAVHQRAWRGR